MTRQTDMRRNERKKNPRIERVESKLGAKLAMLTAALMRVSAASWPRRDEDAEEMLVQAILELVNMRAENAALRAQLALLQNPDAFNVAVSRQYVREVAWLLDAYAHGMIDTAKPDAAYVDRCDELTAQLQEAHQREATATRREAEARAVLDAVATLAVEALWTPDRRTKQRALVNTTGQTVTVIPEQARAWLAAGAPSPNVS